MSRPERNAYSPPRDNALREVRDAVARARKFDATEREVIERVLLGSRGLSLGGPDEKRLTSILAAIWADADEQRES